MDSDTRTIVKREFELSFSEREQLNALLNSCFDGVFKDRLYFKQLPHWRHLLVAGDRIVAQAGVDHRVIRIGEQVATIFGIIDVQPDMRDKGLAHQLLAEIAGLGQAHGVQFAVAMADDQRLYEACGFRNVPAYCRWLAVDNVTSKTVMEENLGECFMMRPLTGMAWPEGMVDLVGYLF
jgi:N-acetylglutamate synthase-like GNAT family acetyltransferase